MPFVGEKSVEGTVVSDTEHGGLPPQGELNGRSITYWTDLAQETAQRVRGGASSALAGCGCLGGTSAGFVVGALISACALSELYIAFGIMYGVGSQEQYLEDNGATVMDVGKYGLIGTGALNGVGALVGALYGCIAGTAAGVAASD